MRTESARHPRPLLETRGWTNKDQRYDVDKRRDGIGDYRLRDYNRLEGSEANDFPRAGTTEIGTEGGGRGSAKGTEEGRTVEGD